MTESRYSDDLRTNLYGTVLLTIMQKKVALKTLKPPSRQPTVCCCVVVAVAYTNRGGRPGLPAWGFNILRKI